VKIDEEAQGLVEKFHVAQKLSLLDRQYFFDRLQFHDQEIVD
jgi:hypothetical protein